LSTRSKPKATGGLQPWHIAIFVIALALGTWQLTRAAIGARRSNDSKVMTSGGPVKMPPQASAKTIERIKDKDSGAE
jgi:cytochrome oxidase assembly protein ShyY1